MNNLQKKLLETLTYLTKYLEEKGLRYYVIGGTMLGAVRHKGFIPWDDDVDIAMPRSDYEKFIQDFKGVVDGYTLETPRGKARDFLYAYGKFYDTRTTVVEKLHRKVKRGVFIDVFPLDGIGDTMEQALKNFKKIDRNNMLFAMKACAIRKGRKWWKNIAVIIGKLIPISIKRQSRRVDKACARVDFDSSKLVGMLMSETRSRAIMPKEVYGEPTFYDFEDIKVRGPQNYEEYLTRIYRNWRQLPPEDKRQTTHGFLEVDLNKSYLEDK